MSYFGSIYAENISHRAKTVYMYLKDRSNAQGECWPGIKTIARELNLSRSTVKRAHCRSHLAWILKKGAAVP